MSNQDTIAHQQRLLSQYRANLSHLLRQREQYRGAVVPLVILSQIDTAREAIQHAKAKLRENGVSVDDLPNEMPPGALACPYPGMVPFRAEEARFFHGRAAEIEQLLLRLRHHSRLLVIGPSGSGKSSLIHAGLVPQLGASSLFPSSFWLVRTLRLAAHPLQALAAALGGELTDPARAAAMLLAAHPPYQRLLLVIDQFEELFALNQRQEQIDTIAVLQQLRQAPNCAVLLAMRADFYPELMSSDLWPIDPSQRIEVTPLRAAALREALSWPASEVGVTLDADLIERLLADSANEPGVLPLLQEAMVLLWERMEDRRITLSDYDRLGGAARNGLAVAIAIRADAAIAALAEAQKVIARRIFVRLVQFGEGRADTRRQLPVSALRAVGDDTALYDATLRALTEHRLLTLSGNETDLDPRVDIAHEALITGWPALQSWIQQRRVAEQTRRSLEGKAQEWVRLGRTGGLLDAMELREAEQWLASADAPELGYSASLPELAEASRAAQHAQEAQRRRAARFRLSAIGAIALLTILALAVGLWSVQQSSANQAQLLDQQRELLRASELRLARETGFRLAVQAREEIDAQPQLALLLAAEALSATQRMQLPSVPAAENVARSALSRYGGRYIGKPTQGEFDAIDLTPDGRWLATWVNNQALVYDLTQPNPTVAARALAIPAASSGEGVDIALSPDGRWLVSSPGAVAANALLWNLATGQSIPIAPLDPYLCSSSMYSKGDAGCLAFSANGRWLILADFPVNETVLWDLSSPDPSAATQRIKGTPMVPGILPISRSRFPFHSDSRDMHWMITVSYGYHLWNLDSPSPAATDRLLEGELEVVLLLPDSWGTRASSDDTHWLRFVADTESIQLLQIGADGIPGQARSLTRLETGRNSSLATDRSGRWLIAFDDQGADIWDLDASKDTPQTHIAFTDQFDGAYPLAIDGQGRWLFASLQNDVVEISLADPAKYVSIMATKEIRAIATSLNGEHLILGDEEGTQIRRFSDFGSWQQALLTEQKRALVDRSSRRLVVGGKPWRVVELERRAAALPFDVKPAEGALVSVAHTGDAYRPLALPQADSVYRFFGDDPRQSTLVVSLQPTIAPMTVTLSLLRLSDPDPIATRHVLLQSFIQKDTDFGHRAALSYDGRWLAVSRADGTTHIWDLYSDDLAERILHFDLPYLPNNIKISSDGRWFATSDEETKVELWDLAAADGQTKRYTLPADDVDLAGDILFTADARLLIIAGQHGARSWQLTPQSLGQPAHALSPTVELSLVTIDPTGRWLVTRTNDRCQLWDLSTNSAAPIDLGAWDKAAREPSMAGFSGDGRWLAMANGDALRLWDLQAAQPTVARLLAVQQVSYIHFTRDERLITIGLNSTALLWHLSDADTSTEPILLASGPGLAGDAFVTPGGQLFVTSVNAFPLQVQELIVLACRTAGRNLTRSEWRQFFGQEPYRPTCPNFPAEPAEP